MGYFDWHEQPGYWRDVTRHFDPGARLLDVGCGSGVIAVAAARLGFAPVVAVDVDEAAVAATKANATANGVAVEARVADASTAELPAADVGIANIALDAVRAIAPRLRVQTLITSGYLASDHPQLDEFEHRDRRERDGWAADVFARRSR